MIELNVMIILRMYIVDVCKAQQMIMIIILTTAEEVVQSFDILSARLVSSMFHTFKIPHVACSLTKRFTTAYIV